MKIEFEITQCGYTFRDAIHLEQDHGLSDSDIDAIKQTRFDIWYTVVTTPVINLDPEVVDEEQE